MHLHITNHGSQRFTGWLRRGIDWKPAHPVGTVQGCRYVVGNDLGIDCRAIDVLVDLHAGASVSLDFETAEPGKQLVGEFIAPQPTIAGTPFGIRSTRANGAGLDVHWRAKVGELWCELWCDLWATLYPGQSWAYGELQVSAHGPGRVALVPEGFVLAAGEGMQAKVLSYADADSAIGEGSTIAAGQGYSALPVVIWNGAEPHPLTIGATGLGSVWPNGNPSWHKSRGSVWAWSNSNDAQASAASLIGWSASRLGINANAQQTGGEGDQVFVGAECSRGLESAGAELVNLFVAYGYARRPGKWREASGDGLDIDAHPNLSMFEGYPSTRTGGTDTLGLEATPTREDAHGWAEWREHWFRNRLFVAYRLTGSRALQWQIDQLARQFLFECTSDRRFSTSTYTGALRGYGWECLMAWWLHHTLEDRDLADAVEVRWFERWERLGGRLRAANIWDIRRDDRLGPGHQWLAYQQAAAVMFMDMAGEAFGADTARDAALRGAWAVLDRAFLHNGDRWVGYAYVPMDGAIPRPLPDGAHFGTGIESWMVGAAVVALRHDNADEKALAIVDQHVRENNVNGQWIAPDVLGLVAD